MRTAPVSSARPAWPGLVLLAVVATWTGAPVEAQPQRVQIGLAAHASRLLVEEGPGHEGPGAADYFGFALATGDFNGDGVDDLVTGLPGNDCDFVVWDCGATLLRLGVAGSGLADAASRQIQAPGPGEPQFAELGATLAAGDFNGDQRDDLAVGMPGYRVEFDDEGAVQIHHGDSIGLTTGVALLREGSSGVPGGAVPQDRFGHALAVGNFDGDLFDDLAIGIPGNLASKGMVTVAHGGFGGLLPFVGYTMQQGIDGLPDVAEFDEQTGYALAAGNFDCDQFDDLAIGVPSEDDVGAVLVVYGSPFSLIFADHQYFSLFDLGNLHQPGSRFGETLAAGDINGDGCDELAIGAPLYDVAGVVDVGQVTIVFGDEPGLNLTFGVHFSQASFPNTSREAGDRFGAALTLADFDGDGFDDLAVGIPGDNYSAVPAVLDSGAAMVVPGRTLFASFGRQLDPGHGPAGMIPDLPQGSPGYGSALAAGDFDGNGFADLAIGAPNRDFSTAADAGGIAVLYGQLFVDGFEAEDAGEWSLQVP